MHQNFGLCHYSIIHNEVFDTDFVDVRYKSDIGQNRSKQNKS